MTSSRLASKLRQSYVAASLRRRDIWAAVVITAGVTVVVGALARVPLRGDVVVDLREDDRVGGLWQVTLIGFWVPTADGRETRGSRARVIFNRPLPATFELHVTARSVRPAAIPVEIRVADAVVPAEFGRTFTDTAVTVDNRTGAREIVLSLPADAALAVQAVAVRSVGEG